MPMDVLRLIGAVSRELTSTTRDGKPARVLVATRSYHTTPDDLWDALTNQGRIPRWFLPISGELRLGGRYQLEGNAGGEILHCEPPSRLLVTWEMQGGVSWVELTLRPDGSKTQLRLAHTAHVPEEFWDRFGPGATGVGWDGALLGLGLHLETPSEALDPRQALVWMQSEEGKHFNTTSSEAWAVASIAAGTPEAAAREAAARTTAFYTGA